MDKIPPLLDTLKKHCDDVSQDYDSIGKSYFAYVIMAETEDQLEELLTARAKERDLSLEEFKQRISGAGAFVGTPNVVQQAFQQLIDLGFDYFRVG